MRNLIVAVMAVFFVASCGSTANEEKPTARYQEKKSSLEETERNNPLQFLKMSNNSDRSNLVNKVVIEGTISNSATLVSYKEIEVGIVFKDKEGDVLEKDRKTLNLTIGPKSSQSVKVKVKKPKGTTSVVFDIVGAVADK